MSSPNRVVAVIGSSRPVASSQSTPQSDSRLPAFIHRIANITANLNTSKAQGTNGLPQLLDTVRAAAKGDGTFSFFFCFPPDFP